MVFTPLWLRIRSVRTTLCSLLRSPLIRNKVYAGGIFRYERDLMCGSIDMMLHVWDYARTNTKQTLYDHYELSQGYDNAETTDENVWQTNFVVRMWGCAGWR